MKTWMLLFLGLSWATESALDFWEKSPLYWKSFRDEREIFVSAKDVEGRTSSLGAGMVEAPVSFVWAFATNPTKIAKTSSLLEDFKWDLETGRVDLYLRLLNFRYHIRGVARREENAENPKVHFDVLDGGDIPFSAVLELRSSKAQALRPGAPSFREGQTLVRISGLSTPERSLGWWKRVALEAVLQRVALTLRAAVEAEYRNQN